MTEIWNRVDHVDNTLLYTLRDEDDGGRSNELMVRIERAPTAGGEADIDSVTRRISAALACDEASFSKILDLARAKIVEQISKKGFNENRRALIDTIDNAIDSLDVNSCSPNRSNEDTSMAP